jgi:hypothetical protein
MDKNQDFGMNFYALPCNKAWFNTRLKCSTAQRFKIDAAEERKPNRFSSKLLKRIVSFLTDRLETKIASFVVFYNYSAFTGS